MNVTLFSLFFPLLISLSLAFVPGRTPRTPGTAVNDIHEWRDLAWDDSSSSSSSATELPAKKISLLPFPFPEVLLQGETKQLRLYEDRFIQLFEQAINEHGSLVGMGLLADAGIIQTIPLCELEAFNRMEGFGIFCTIRAVGRAQLEEIKQQEPYLKATCREVSDELPPNLELPNLVAQQIETLVEKMTRMEYQLKQAALNRSLLADDDTQEEDNEMTRRIQIAELEDRFYHEDDEDDEDGDHEVEMDRLRRFQHAYAVAMNTDTQGYQVIAQQSNLSERTPQQLTAISWAAFCTEANEEKDATFRIQALDANSLFERLKLGHVLLRRKETDLKAQLEKAGLQQDEDDI